jgi:hypothetical protein
MRPAPARPFAPTMLSAWQEQLTATHDSSLKHQCMKREGKLLPRFAAHYEKPEILPRRRQYQIT